MSIQRVSCAWNLWILCRANPNKESGRLKHETALRRNISTDANLDHLLSIFKASRLAPTYSYAFFKTGLMPKVEDPINWMGGRFCFCYTKPILGRHGEIDLYWKQLLKGLIHNEFRDSNSRICGIKVHWDIRSYGLFICRIYKFQIWVQGSNTDPSRIEEMKQKLRTVVGDPDIEIVHELHRNRHLVSKRLN